MRACRQLTWLLAQGDSPAFPKPLTLTKRSKTRLDLPKLPGCKVCAQDSFTTELCQRQPPPQLPQLIAFTSFYINKSLVQGDILPTCQAEWNSSSVCSAWEVQHPDLPPKSSPEKECFPFIRISELIWITQQLRAPSWMPKEELLKICLR